MKFPFYFYFDPTFNHLFPDVVACAGVGGSGPGISKTPGSSARCDFVNFFSSPFKL